MTRARRLSQQIEARQHPLTAPTIVRPPTSAAPDVHPVPVNPDQTDIL